MSSRVLEPISELSADPSEAKAQLLELVRAGFLSQDEANRIKRKRGIQ